MSLINLVADENVLLLDELFGDLANITCRRVGIAINC